MALKWYTVVVDAKDPAALARWWAQTLDFAIVYESEHEVVIIPSWVNPADPDQTPWERRGQGMVFVPVPEGKQVKNRLHIDLAPHLEQDRDSEIETLLARGASTIHVGQEDDVSWTVMADPEGNEFCVLSSRAA